MKSLKIKKGDEATAPSADTVRDGSYALSRPLFIYISKNSLQRPEVLKFSEFYLETITALATEVKYVPFEPALYDLIKERLAQQKTGTMFGGEAETHRSLTEVLKAAP